MAFFNIHTFITLSFFFFLLSCHSSTPLSPPSSTHAAANTLRNRGYSLFASTIINNNNFSGTILAPPDFTFSISTLQHFTPFLSSPPLPHSQHHPHITYAHLLSNINGQISIPTLYNNKCLFFFKTPNGEISVSETKNSNVGAVKIRQPDIYVDDNLTVHGIDGVLDPTSAKPCTNQQVVNRSFLDHAIKALRKRRFTVTATALTIKRSELLSLTSVALFAPSDMALFSRPDGFRYDYRHHVVPQGYRFGDLAKGSMVIETLDSNKTLVVKFVEGFATVNGVIVNGTEVYRNKWIVVLSVAMSLDDAVDSGSFAPSPAPSITDIPFSDEIDNSSVESPAPAIMNGFKGSFQSPVPATMEIHYPNERINASIAVVQSAPPMTVEIRHPDEITNGSFQTPAPSKTDIRFPDVIVNASYQSPAPATVYKINASIAGVKSPVNDTRCVLGIEGGDLLCGPHERQLQEKENLIDQHVAHSPPAYVNQSLPLISSDSVGEEHSRRRNIIDQNHQHHLNIADDLFCYF